VSDWVVSLAFAAPTKEWYAERNLASEDYVVARFIPTRKIGIQTLEAKGTFSKKLWMAIGQEKMMRLHIVINHAVSFVGPVLIGANEPILFKVGEDFDGGGEVIMRGKDL
jgi:hypothetical protein